MIKVIVKSVNNEWDMLHPLNQVKTVEKCVKEYISNGEDIVIYTISPIVVEAFTLYCRINNIIDDLQYELNGVEISPYESKIIYDDFCKAYDVLDEIRLELEFGNYD